jgi:hypothetical protein
MLTPGIGHNSGQTARDRRIALGQCPDCGKEAAPYRLCASCRGIKRLGRALNRGARLGVLYKTSDGRFGLNEKAPPDARKEWAKWQTAFVRDPEKDKRAAPRLAGSRVDFGEILVKIMRALNRPVTEIELQEAYGKLRASRQSPLHCDLAQIIKADSKRARRAERMRRTVVDTLETL